MTRTIILLASLIMSGMLTASAEPGLSRVQDPDLGRLRQFALATQAPPWEAISHSAVSVRKGDEVLMVRWQIGQRFPIRYYQYHEPLGELASVTVLTGKTSYYTFAPDGRLIARREGNTCFRESDGLLVREPCSARYILTARPGRAD